MTDGRLTEHFILAELACHSGEATPEVVVPNLLRLARTVLEPIRLEWGSPVVVISGWRSEEYNRRIHGAAQSRHVTGEAADIRPIAMAALNQFRNMIEGQLLRGKLAGIGGIGFYPGRWVHVDIRLRKSDGALARWDGIGVGSEVT